ncbi:MAG TPA: chromosomal replication initiator protein DnaA [Myxococcota bacterium]|jgi:chromosomal replication initiator protein|nr:chromosomal replication initiator protein DnaA [Myxococcota bacterium]
MSFPPIWDGVLRRLGADIPAFSLEAWIRPLAARQDDRGLRLICPSGFHLERVRSRFLDAIEQAASHEAGVPVPVRLEIGSTAASAPIAATAAADAGTVSIASGRSRPSLAVARDHEAEAKAPSAATAPARRAPVQRVLPHSFSSFVVGPCNALAREAAYALAQGRQLGVSPLLLVSTPGLGKTHLARAVSEEARRYGIERVIYASTETFTSEFLSSIRAQRMAVFKRRYRQECELLVIEDVQFLRGKVSTQLELFHTIDHLLSTGARVMLTGDRLPRDIPDLDPRLRSQMTSGLVAEIEPPDAQVRRAILRDKAAAGGVRLPDDCLDRLVEDVRGSVRDLEGVLIQLVATASLLKRTIDLALTEQALRKLAAEESRERALEPEHVIEVVAGYFRTTPQALAARSRRRDVLVPRQLAMYLARRYTEASLQRIGEALGRDHPAVSHALQVVERQILERAPLRYQVEALAARLDELAGCRRPGRTPGRAVVGSGVGAGG